MTFELVLPTMPHLQEAVVDACRTGRCSPRSCSANRRSEPSPDRVWRRWPNPARDLELALAGVPMVTGYRTGSMEAWILRRAIKVNSVILANLVIGENVIPEFLQEHCTPEKLCRHYPM